ncbi:MAG: hypothetical protein J6Y02_24120 [Pseudobutyrivibrio sp.]|nr:hypothetical protein [Pseudobutyrivibrio sp.]
MDRTKFVYELMSRMDINEGLLPIYINSQLCITDDEVTLIDSYPNPYLMPSWIEGSTMFKMPSPDGLATAVLLVTKKSDPDKNISMVSIRPKTEITVYTDAEHSEDDYIVKCKEEHGMCISIKYNPHAAVVMIITNPMEKENAAKKFEADLLNGVITLVDPEEDNEEQETEYLEGLIHKINVLYDIALSNQETLKIYRRTLPDHYGVEIPMDFITQDDQVLCSLFSTLSSLLKLRDLNFIPPINAWQYVDLMDIDTSMILDVDRSKYKIVDCAKDESYSDIYAIYTKIFKEANNTLNVISNILSDPSNDTLYFIEEVRSGIKDTIKTINGYQSVISTKEE